MEEVRTGLKLETEPLRANFRRKGAVIKYHPFFHLNNLLSSSKIPIVIIFNTQTLAYKFPFVGDIEHLSSPVSCDENQLLNLLSIGGVGGVRRDHHRIWLPLSCHLGNRNILTWSINKRPSISALLPAAGLK